MYSANLRIVNTLITPTIKLTCVYTLLLSSMCSNLIYESQLTLSLHYIDLVYMKIRNRDQKNIRSILIYWSQFDICNNNLENICNNWGNFQNSYYLGQLFYSRNLSLVLCFLLVNSMYTAPYYTVAFCEFGPYCLASY